MTERNLDEEQKAEIENKLQSILEMQKEIKFFNENALNILDDLYKNTKPEIQQQVNEEFINGIVEADTTILEIGKEFKRCMNESFNEVLKRTPKDKVLSAEQRNLVTAALLNLFEPIENFTKSDAKRKEALTHVLFINAACRSIPIRFYGCKYLWDMEDQQVKEAKDRLKEVNKSQETN